jgi:hypothetical protein
MKRFLFFFVFILLVCTFSCRQIPQPPVSEKGELESVQLSDLKGIPAEFGSLISVTVSPEFPNWAQLWFQDDTKNIRIVRVGWMENRIHQNVVIIPRY